MVWTHGLSLGSPEADPEIRSQEQGADLGGEAGQLWWGNGNVGQRSKGNQEKEH